MKRYTKSKEVRIPRVAIDQILKADTDFDIWTASLLAGLTTMIKPETISSEIFYNEEVMVLEEIQEYGIDDSPLYKNRWTL